jgi:multimeric flavodoxin WrbA
MGKTLLGVIGSPRKHGNSELFVKELYRQLPSGWDLSLMRLPDFDIRPCKACYQCLFGDGKCPQEDDFSLALGSMVASDAYVVAAPTYLLGPNSCLKRFLDRGLCFYGHLDELWAKPAVGVAIAGIQGMEGYTKLAIESFIKLTMADLRGAEVLYGALPGEIFLQNGGRETAKRLAEALIGGKKKPVSDIPSCPVCGGDTFRFMSDGRLRCMLCSSSGSYRWNEERLSIDTAPGEHPLFLSLESAKRHAEWLKGMKEQFLARRKELKAVTADYVQIGTWVDPRKAEE